MRGLGVYVGIHRNDVSTTFLKDARFYGDGDEGGAVRHEFEESEIFVERSTVTKWWKSESA